MAELSEISIPERFTNYEGSVEELRSQLQNILLVAEVDEKQARLLVTEFYESHSELHESAELYVFIAEFEYFLNSYERAVYFLELGNQEKAEPVNAINTKLLEFQNKNYHEITEILPHIEHWKVLQQSKSIQALEYDKEYEVSDSIWQEYLDEGTSQQRIHIASQDMKYVEVLPNLSEDRYE